MDVPENQHAAWEDSLFDVDAEGNPRERERVVSEEQLELGPMVSLQIALLGLIAGADPRHVGLIDLYQELLGWTDEIKEQIDEYETSEGVVKAAGEWDRAHPNSQGHCDNDDLRMCVTAYALKEALREVR